MAAHPPLRFAATRRLRHWHAMPAERRILTWDRWLAPVARVPDPLWGGAAGKSILGVGKRES